MKKTGINKTVGKLHFDKTRNEKMMEKRIYLDKYLEIKSFCLKVTQNHNTAE